MRGVTYKQRKGQAVVETALMLPIIILILTGIIDFGLMFNSYLVINNASREGARNAAVGSGDAGVGIIISNITSTLDSAKLKIAVTPKESIRRRGGEVMVTVEYQYYCFTPVISSILNKTVVLKASTVMRIE